MANLPVSWALQGLALTVLHPEPSVLVGDPGPQQGAAPGVLGGGPSAEGGCAS